MRIVTCLVEQHNLWLVLVAAIVCALGSWTSMRLYARARSSEGFPAWSFLSAITIGATVWCTHFVAMMAYAPGVPIAYDPRRTVLSLVVAVAGAAVALAVGTRRVKYSGLLGGGILGLGIAGMHYSGMSAVTMEAIVTWDWGYVAASIAASVFFGAVSLEVSQFQPSPWRVVHAAVAFMLGVVVLHFAAMGALVVTPLAPLPGETQFDAAREFLGLAVAGVGVVIMGTGVASYIADHQMLTRSMLLRRHLLESSVDCIAITQNGKVVEVNTAFADLVGLGRKALVGRPITDWIMQDREVAGLVPMVARSHDGKAIPVEVAVHREATSVLGPPLVYYSIRDLRPRLAREQEIFSLARNDSLTGLANRHWFREQLNQLLARGDQSFALLFIDLDRFKEINDSLGHQVGDELLKSVATRIRTTVRRTDILARIGGDEFAIIICGGKQPAMAKAVAGFVIAELSKPFEVGGYRVNIGASIGISLSPEHGTDCDGLLKKADISMYNAKSAGRGRYSVFESGSDERLKARLSLEMELRNALSRGQFELFYQPQVEARTNRIVSCEALLRWRHPDRGLVPPIEFIPLAEEIGLMESVGAWAIQQACMDALQWPIPISVAVNVSACQFADGEVEQQVKTALNTTQLPPHRLELEITESLLMTNTDEMIATLKRIRASGVKIAMDDFGTGYSSLAYLTRFPIDKVKIDKSFVSSSEEPRSGAVIRAIISLSNSLGMITTAEGIETDEQRQLLIEKGCGLLQGYHFSKPASAAALRAMLMRESVKEVA